VVKRLKVTVGKDGGLVVSSNPTFPRGHHLIVWQLVSKVRGKRAALHFQWVKPGPPANVFSGFAGLGTTGVMSDLDSSDGGPWEYTLTLTTGGKTYTTKRIRRGKRTTGAKQPPTRVWQGEGSNPNIKNN
jgi:hypothetical protein